MKTAYEVLKSLKGLARVKDIQTIAPRVIDENRVVKGREDRGGFYTSVGVTYGANGKANLYITSRDLKVFDVEADAFGFTRMVVASFDGERFQYVNCEFEAQVTRATYESLLEIGCVAPDADLRKMVTVNLSHLPVFPRLVLDAAYMSDKATLTEANHQLSELKKLRTAARAWFKKNGVAPFRGLEPSQERGEGDPTKWVLEIPYHACRVILGDWFSPTSIDTSLYRVEWFKGKAKRTDYTAPLYRKLRADILRTERKVSKLAYWVRVRELSHLEHSPWELKITADDRDAFMLIEREAETKYVTKEAAQAFLSRGEAATVVREGM
jgi:hypothetical protein